MKASVDKWEMRKFAEMYPSFLDCPPFIFIEVQQVLTEEAAKRLQAPLKGRTKSKAAKKKR